MKPLQRSWSALGNLLFPSECLFCQSLNCVHGKTFCSLCESQIISDYNRCQKCATPIPNVIPNADCSRCRGKGWRFARVLTLGPYRDQLSRLVVEMKRPHAGLLRRGISRLLFEYLAQENPLLGQESPLVIPVPNHWSHRILGSADVAGELAASVAEQAGWSMDAKIIRRIRKTSKQGMLAWSERPKNVRGAFAISTKEPLLNRHIVLIDDVLTSGATCAEISKLLVQSGAAEVSVLVVARGTGAKEMPKLNSDLD